MKCSKCETVKPKSKFRFVKARKQYRTICKDCDRVAAAARFQTNSVDWDCRTKEARQEERRQHNASIGIEYRTHDQIVEVGTKRRALLEKQRQQREAERVAMRPIRIAQASAKRTLDFNIQYKTDVDFRNKQRRRIADRRGRRGVSHYMPWYIRLFFKGGVQYQQPLESLLGYSLSTLRKHIERQFVDSMTWQQYLDAMIVIDHKKPLHLFDLLDARQFSEAWALSNLQ